MNLSPAKLWSKRSVKTAALGLLVLVGVGALMPVTVYTRTRRQCSLCRTERIEQSLFGRHWETIRPTEFTAWFQTNMPPHKHDWWRATCTVGRNVFGSANYFACGPVHPIFGLSPKEELEFMLKATPNQKDQFFALAFSTNRSERFDACIFALDVVLEKATEH